MIFISSINNIRSQSIENNISFINAPSPGLLDIYKGPPECGTPFQLSGYGLQNIYILTLNDSTKYHCLFKVVSLVHGKYAYSHDDNLLTCKTETTNIYSICNSRSFYNTNNLQEDIKNDVYNIRRIEAYGDHLVLLTSQGDIYVKSFLSSFRLFDRKNSGTTLTNSINEFTENFVNDFTVSEQRLVYVVGRSRVCVIDIYSEYFIGNMAPESNCITIAKNQNENGDKYHVIGDVMLSDTIVFTLIYDDIESSSNKQQIYAHRFKTADNGNNPKGRTIFDSNHFNIADKLLSSRLNFLNEKFYASVVTKDPIPVNEADSIVNNWIAQHKIYVQESTDKLFCYNNKDSKLVYDSSRLDPGNKHDILDIYVSPNRLYVVHPTNLVYFKPDETCSEIDLSTGRLVFKMGTNQHIISSYVTMSINHVLYENSQGNVLYFIYEDDQKIRTLSAHMI